MSPLLFAADTALPLTAWLHDLDPFIVRFSGDFGLRWYGFSYLMGFVAGFILLRWLAKRGVAPIPAKFAGDAIFTLILGVIIGGRLGYVLLYQPGLLVDFSSSVPFWGVLRLTDGGMSSHGGMVGVVLAAWRLSRGFREEDGSRVGQTQPRRVFDTMVMIVPPGLLFGRLANFINGELLGRVVAGPGEVAPWWAVRYPQEILERPLAELPQTDAQLAEINQLAMSQLLPNEQLLAPNDAFELGYARVVEKIQGGHVELAAQLEPLLTARVPSQLLQAIAEGVLTFVVVWFVARKPHRAGVPAAAFLIAYGLGRIATEFVRLADSHFTGTGLLDAARPLGLARGQWLSVLMVLIGVAMLLWLRSRGEARVPGWAAGASGDAKRADQADSGSSDG